MPLNVVVEWLTLLVHIQEVTGSNLSPGTGYLAWRSWFSSVIPGKFRESTLNETTAASFHILSNSSFTYPFFDAI
jgi:hypothetical protein